MSEHDTDDEDKNDDYSKQDGKKVTAAITDAPQEEFIGTETVPSRTENPNTPADSGEPREQKQS